MVGCTTDHLLSRPSLCLCCYAIYCRRQVGWEGGAEGGGVQVCVVRLHICFESVAVSERCSWPGSVRLPAVSCFGGISPQWTNPVLEPHHRSERWLSLDSRSSACVVCMAVFCGSVLSHGGRKGSEVFSDCCMGRDGTGPGRRGCRRRVFFVFGVMRARALLALLCTNLFEINRLFENKIMKSQTEPLSPALIRETGGTQSVFFF